MKILHVINSLNIGGAERLLVDFIGFYKKNFPKDKHYILTLIGEGKLLKTVTPDIENSFTLNLSAENKFLLKTRKVNEIIHKEGIELVHAHLSYSILLARLSTPRHIPIFSTYHNMEYCKESPNYSWKFPLIDNFLYSPKNCFSIFVSSEVKKCVQNRISKIKNSAVIPNFAAERFYANYSFKEEDELKLITVGGLKKVKNQTYLLDVLYKLNSKKVSLHIYGEGSLRPELQSKVDKLKLQVTLKGNYFITSELLSEYDLFVLPSFSEGMPISLIEAMITGMPSLLSELPQLIEVAKKSALYFNPHNPNSLVKQIELILEEKSLLKQMSKNAVIYSKDFSIDNYVSQVYKYYHSYMKE